MNDPFSSVPIDNKSAWVRVKQLSYSLIFRCGHPRGGCPTHCDPLVKIFELACERLSAEPSTPVDAQGGTQETTANLMTNLACILDTVKQEWGESWSDWDQRQRDGITEFLKGFYGAGVAASQPTTDKKETDLCPNCGGPKDHPQYTHTAPRDRHWNCTHKFHALAADKQEWEVVPGGEFDDWGIRRKGETQGKSVAQMLYEDDAKHIVDLHNRNL